MRVRRPVLIAAMASCLAAAPAAAAPTCQDVNGTVARCGTANAMPQGWKLSGDEFHRRQEAIGNVFDANEVIGAIALIAGLLAIVALLPNFDGRSGADWDEQEGDRRRRR